MPSGALCEADAYATAYLGYLGLLGPLGLPRLPGLLGLPGLPGLPRRPGLLGLHRTSVSDTIVPRFDASGDETIKDFF